MKTYSKIETLLNRDENFRVTDEFRLPTFGIIYKWVVTEKVDGTNIRIRFNWSDAGMNYDIGGKTDNAQIPVKLYDVLNPLAKEMLDEVAKIFEEFGLDSLTLYGEGYGPGIQKGHLYRDDLGFILYDILVDDKAWLDDNQVTANAKRLGLERVPILSNGDSVEEIIEYVRDGFPSLVASKHDKVHQAEGIVARPAVPLYDRRGERVIFKLKTKDFKAGKN
jgi:ATP-dependent RNA circularization protein (DNA/RNA ligase family)